MPAPLLPKTIVDLDTLEDDARARITPYELVKVSMVEWWR